MATQNLGRVVGSKIYTGTASNTNEIASQLSALGIVPLIFDIFISKNTDMYQYQLIENVPTWAYIMSLKGETGTFRISKTYASVVDMNNGYATDGLPKGALVVISTGNVDDEDNAKLYCKGNTEYEFLTDMSGAQGIQGPQGTQGVKGDKGATGSTFIPTVSSEGVISWSNNGGLANPSSVNIRGPQGIQGIAGINGKDGTNGKDGVTPTLSLNANGELIATYE